MKHLFTKFFLVIACAMLGVNAWAVEETLASFSNSSNTGWTISGSPSYSNTGGYQLVASSMTITSPSIDFSEYENINITITCRKYGGPNTTQGKISVKLGSTSGTELATYSPSGTTLASSGALSISPSSNGSLVIYCPGASSSKGCGISQIEIKGTPIATEAYTVTFDAGTNGVCSISDLTEATPGAGVTLPSCTPNTGYGFLGWTATQDKTTIDTGLTAGSTYNPSADVTLYAVYGALYQVTIENPTNGTLAVTCEGNDVTSGEYYAVGKNINIVATPNTGYKFRNIQVVDNSTHTFTSSNTKVWSMGNEAITIKANFDEIVYHTITWSVNGNTSLLPQSVVEAETVITFPTGLADINGKKFVGWSGNSEASSAGDIITVEQTANSSSTFYAVYATVTPGATETATLTCGATVANSSYTNSTPTDDKGNEWHLYTNIVKQSINSTDHYYYGLNSSSNGYNIESPEFSGNVISINAYVWNTNSNTDRKAVLCSSNTTKQPATGDLGEMAINRNTKYVEQTFTITAQEEFTKFYIYATNAGAIGLESIEVTYGEPDTYSEYTTTVALPQQFDATVSTSGLTTVCLPYAAELSEEAKTAGAHVWALTNIDENGIHLTEVDALIADRGYIIQGTASSTVTLVECDEPAEDGNLLNGVTERTRVEDLTFEGEGAYAYPWILNKNNEFIKYTGVELPANKAYLDGGWLYAAGVSLTSTLRVIFEDNEPGIETGVGDIIDEEDVPLIIHTLHGVLVKKVVKDDFYIVNRKSVRYLKAE